MLNYRPILKLYVNCCYRVSYGLCLSGHALFTAVWLLTKSCLNMIQPLCSMMSTIQLLSWLKANRLCSCFIVFRLDPFLNYYYCYFVLNTCYWNCYHYIIMECSCSIGTFKGEVCHKLSYSRSSVLHTISEFTEEQKTLFSIRTGCDDIKTFAPFTRLNF